EGEQRPLPPSVDEVAYRIVQESLTNVLRHAGPAARATVRLCYEPAALGITVIDDGGNGSHPPASGASDGSAPASRPGQGPRPVVAGASRPAGVPGGSSPQASRATGWQGWRSGRRRSAAR